MAVYAIDDGDRTPKEIFMRFRTASKSMALASALILIGAGCTSPFAPKGPTPLPAGETYERDTSGRTFSEQADIVVEAALDEGKFEQDTAGSVGSDTSFFTDDDRELNDLENSYDENEL
jgi:hypothetical protein